MNRKVEDDRVRKLIKEGWRRTIEKGEETFTYSIPPQSPLWSIREVVERCVSELSGSGENDRAVRFADHEMTHAAASVTYPIRGADVHVKFDLSGQLVGAEISFPHNCGGDGRANCPMYIMDRMVILEAPNIYETVTGGASDSDGLLFIRCYSRLRQLLGRKAADRYTDAVPGIAKRRVQRAFSARIG